MRVRRMADDATDGGLNEPAKELRRQPKGREHEHEF